MDGFSQVRRALRKVSLGGSDSGPRAGVRAHTCKHHYAGPQDVCMRSHDGVRSVPVWGSGVLPTPSPRSCPSRARCSPRGPVGARTAPRGAIQPIYILPGMPTAASSGYLGPEDFGAYGREVHAAFERLFGVSWEEPSPARSLCCGRPPLCPSKAEGEAVEILRCAYELRGRIGPLLARQRFPRERWTYLERLMRDLLVRHTFTHAAGAPGVAVHMEAPIFALRRESEATFLPAERRRLVLFLASRFPGLLGRWLPSQAKVRGVNHARPGASRMAGLTEAPGHSPSAPTFASEDSRQAGECDRFPVSHGGSRRGASQNEPNVLLRGIAAGLALGRWIPKERMRTAATGAVRFQKVVTIGRSAKGKSAGSLIFSISTAVA